jgi:hypothetical protein
MTQEQKLALVAQLARVKSQGDVEAALAIYHPEVELSWPSLGSMARGTEAVRQGLETFFRVFPDYRISLTSSCMAGEVLMADAQATLTPHVGAGAGRTVSLPVQLEFHFSQERVRKEVFELNRDQLLALAGISLPDFVQALSAPRLAIA